MSMTIAEKILARASGIASVRAGDFVWAVPDLVIAHDLNYPRYRKIMGDAGLPRLVNPGKFLVTIDHTTYADDTGSLAQHRAMREDVRAQGVGRFFDIGQHGISHNVPLDEGLVKPGMLVIASDTRAPALGCTGALAIAIGIGLLTVMSTGKGWFRVPETVRVNLSGHLQPGVMSRDLAQWIAHRIGSEAGDYRSIEFAGPFVDLASEDARHTLCNAMVDSGCKAAVCELSTADAVRSDADARFVQTLDIDVSALEPQISVPPEPENVRPLRELIGTPISHAFVGSCIGGKLEDLRAAASVLRGRRVAPGVRLVVIPATQAIHRQALAEGLMAVFAEAGAATAAGICGPCYGTFAPLGDGDVSIGTPTRNDSGRMGSEQATIYIANAAVVAASAVAGKIESPRSLPREEAR